jgi:hypothetical protein
MGRGPLGRLRSRKGQRTAAVIGATFTTAAVLTVMATGFVIQGQLFDSCDTQVILE